MSVNLSGVGIWSGALRFGDAGAISEAAGELEEMGYSALWIPGGIGGDIFDSSRRLLDATHNIAVATGILNLWMHTPAETAAGHAAITAAHPNRFLLGVGISHAPLVDAAEPGRYQKPIAKTIEFLDALDAQSPAVPRDELALAALGPRMLELARDRTRGAHPYLVTPDHTRFARQILGAGPLLAPEVAAVLDTDAARARATARQHFTTYLGLPNYVNNLRRVGFTDDDFANGGSDRLIDGVIVHGNAERIADRVREHQAAGADHVCVQIISGDFTRLPLVEWRDLAAAVL